MYSSSLLFYESTLKIRGDNLEFTSEQRYENGKLSLLYNTYENKMYSIAYSILNNVEQAEDAVQDAFMKLIPYLHKIIIIDSLKTKRLVILTIKNVAIDKYRRNKKETQLFTEEADEALPSDDTHSLPSVKNIEDRQMVVQILSNLQPIYREILQYRCFYSLTYKEISALLNISEAVAAKRYERAKEQVKKYIGDKFYE